MLVCDWAKKYFCAQLEASIYCATFVIFLYQTITRKLDCFLYAPKKISLARAGDRVSSRIVFSKFKMSPKSLLLLPVSFDPLASLRRNI